MLFVECSPSNNYGASFRNNNNNNNNNNNSNNNNNNVGGSLRNNNDLQELKSNIESLMNNLQILVTNVGCLMNDLQGVFTNIGSLVNDLRLFNIQLQSFNIGLQKFNLHNTNFKNNDNLQLLKVDLLNFENNLQNFYDLPVVSTILNDHEEYKQNFEILKITSQHFTLQIRLFFTTSHCSSE